MSIEIFDIVTDGLVPLHTGRAAVAVKSIIGEMPTITVLGGTRTPKAPTYESGQLNVSASIDISGQRTAILLAIQGSTGQMADNIYQKSDLEWLSLVSKPGDIVYIADARTNGVTKPGAVLRTDTEWVEMITGTTVSP